MPILMAPLDRDLKILRIAAEEKTKKHLANLGILAGATVRVLSNSGGSVVCQIKDGRLALDRDVSTRILVTA